MQEIIKQKIQQYYLIKIKNLYVTNTYNVKEIFRKITE